MEVGRKKQDFHIFNELQNEIATIKNKAHDKNKEHKSILESKLVINMDVLEDKYEGGYRRWIKGFKTRMNEIKPNIVQVLNWIEKLGRDDMNKRKDLEGLTAETIMKEEFAKAVSLGHFSEHTNSEDISRELYGVLFDKTKGTAHRKIDNVSVGDGVLAYWNGRLGNLKREEERHLKTKRGSQA